jgi:hypothetical protein
VEADGFYDPMASAGHRFALGLELAPSAAYASSQALADPASDAELPPLPLPHTPQFDKPMFAFEEVEAQWQRRARFEMEEKQRMLQAQQEWKSAVPGEGGDPAQDGYEAHRAAAKDVLKTLTLKGGAMERAGARPPARVLPYK